MNNIKEHIKILSTLSLAASNTRADTLSSIIIKTLDLSSGALLKTEIGEAIQKQFQFKPYKTELDNNIEKLVNDGQLLNKDGFISLSEEKANLIKATDTALNDADKKRFQNFKSFIQDDLERDIPISDIKIIWHHFLDYLYSCFFEYGQEALKTLHPHISFENDADFDNLASNATSQLKKERKDLVDIFQQAIDQFPNYASEDDLDFLVELAQKTSSFSSLGIDPNSVSIALDKELIDWTLYLDTNVLYSLLDLHSNPETEASKALIQLILDNSDIIKIKLRYSEYTYRELKNKQKDFQLLDSKMSSPAIKALLKSGKVDSFSEEFYRKLLVDPNTLHPSEVVELSQAELKSNNIKIGRNKARVQKMGENYLNAQISDYFKYIEERNLIKEEFSKSHKLNFSPVNKSEAQVRHDIILREILRDSRNVKSEEELTMNNVKFFGLTLDSMLIGFDRSKVKDYYDEDKYPIFFKPSFLLDKLTRILPVQTRNYKKAFVKALTTKGFHRNGKKSRDILSLVNHLQKKGIDNTEVIYNLINEDLFLDKLKAVEQSKEFDKDAFISSEINRRLEEAQKKLDETTKDLAKASKKNEQTEKENRRLQKEKENASVEVNQYLRAVNTLSNRVKKIEKHPGSSMQAEIDFIGASEKQQLSDENIDLKRQLKSQAEEEIEDYKDKRLKKWQQSVWWNLFWSIPVVLFTLLLLIPNSIFHITPDEQNKKLLEIIFQVAGFLLSLFFIGLVWYRYQNETAKTRKRDGFRVPKELKDKLEKLQ